MSTTEVIDGLINRAQNLEDEPVRRALMAVRDAHTAESQQNESNLATIRAALKRTGEEKEQIRREYDQIKANYEYATRAVDNVLRLLPSRKTDSWEDAVNGWLKETEELKADAKASEMMLAQVCDERDATVREVIKLRELLRDCPLIRKFNSVSEFIEHIRSPECEAWAEKANEEVLKL